MKLLNKVNKNTSSSWLLTVLQVLTSVILLPLTIKYYSNVEISLWIIFNTIMALTGVADLGFGPTLVRIVAAFFGGSKRVSFLNHTDEEVRDVNPNKKGLIDLVGTSAIIYLYLTGITLVLALTVGFALVWNIMKLGNNDLKLWMAYVFIVINSGCYVLSIRWRSICQGLNLVKDVNLFFTKTVIAVSLTQYALVIFRFSLYYVALSFLIQTIVVLFYARRLALKKIKSIPSDDNTTKFKYNHQLFLEIWPSTWRLGFTQIGGYFINYGTTLVIAQLPNAASVASFLLTKRVLDYARSIAQIPFYSNIQTIYAEIAINNKDEVSRVSFQYIKMSLILLLLFSVPLIAFGNFSIHLLSKSSSFAEWYIILIMSVTALLEMHHSIHASIYISSNHNPFLLPSLISGGVIVLLSFLIGLHYGILAIVSIQMLVQLAFNNWYPVMLNLRMMGWSYRYYFSRIFLKLN
jgi:O-antigen/teichoic acid export membrane protein